MTKKSLTIHTEGKTGEEESQIFEQFVSQISNDSEEVVIASTVAPNGSFRSKYYVYHHKGCTIKVRYSTFYSPRYSLDVYGSEDKVKRTLRFIKGLESEVLLVK